jgi:hypothetical protein
MCDYSCTSGLKCGGGCFQCCADTDCTVNASVQTGACTNSSCVYTCKSGYASCTTENPACVLFNNGFEDGTINGWESSMTTAPFTALSVGTPSMLHGGTHALKSSITNGAGLLRITRPMCASASDDSTMTGHTVTFWVFWDGPALPTGDTASGCELSYWYQAGSTLTNAQGSNRVIKPTSGWQMMTSSVFSFQPIRRIGVDCYVNSTWTGTIYLDDFTLN